MLMCVLTLSRLVGQELCVHEKSCLSVSHIFKSFFALYSSWTICKTCVEGRDKREVAKGGCIRSDFHTLIIKHWLARSEKGVLLMVFSQRRNADP